MDPTGMTSSMAPTQLAAAPAVGEVLIRLAIDLLAIAVLAYGLYYRRHRRRDMFVVLVLFNVGLFVALQAIVGGEISVAVGFGLFAVLSIVRLRSEQFDFDEMGYFFLALVLALVSGLEGGGAALSAILTAVLLLVALVVDHPRLVRPTRRTELVLERVFPDEDVLVRHVEQRLGARVAELSVREIDYVRETTRVVVRSAAWQTRPGAKERRDVPVADLAG
jgi:hypothetical protein